VGSDELSRRRALGVLGAVFLGACGGATAHRASGAPPSTSGEEPSPATTSSTTAAAAGTTVAPVVAGSNANITHQILADDAKGYNGTWTAAWKMDTFGTTGTISANATIDPDARTFTAHISVTGDLLHDGVAIPSFTVDGSVDSYTYGNDGSFAIHKRTPAGDGTITSVGGMGSGQFHLKLTDIPSHPSVRSFDASGVANRAGVIPTTLRVTFADGTTASGSCQFGQGGA
jgi:hypothetical protein